MVYTSDGAVDYVPGRVATRFGGRKADRVQTIEYPREALRPDPVELHVLADGYVDQAPAILGGKIGDRFQLAWRQVSPGYPDSDHEETVLSRALSIEAITSKPDQVISANRP